MIDARPAVEQMQAAFPQALIEVCAVHGIPMLRLKKQDLPTVAHFLHTNPNLRGSLSLLSLHVGGTQRLAAARDGSPW